MISNKVRRQFISLDLGFRSVGFCLRHNPTFPAVDRDSQQKTNQKVIELPPREKKCFVAGFVDEEPGGREKVLYEAVMKKFFMELLPSSNQPKKMT